jgi:type VI secretion system secreted protein VgrG
LLLTATLSHSALPGIHLTHFRVHEGMSTPFSVDVEFLSDDPDLDLDALLGSTALVALTDDAGGSRLFHGVIEEAEFLEMRRVVFHYRVRMRPLLHGLAYRVRTRIFQNLDVTAIVKKVCADAGLPGTGFDWSKVAGPYSTREFCMQYKESELAFVMRLLEEEGIFFWFEHSATGHVMHFGEDKAACQPIDGNPFVTAYHLTSGKHLDHEWVCDLRFTTKLCHEVFHTRDWNWQQPRNPLDAQANGDATTGRVAYEYPGGFTMTGAGGTLAQVRLDAELVEKYVVDGWTTSYRLSPGRTFTVDDATPDYMSDEYFIVSVDHEYHRGSVAGEDRRSGEDHLAYRATFRGVPSSVTYQAPRVTPRPRIFGKESAVVTGPEEIHVDSFGRIKVYFYFDREDAVDENASCWLRVQQQNTSGSMILPRRGWEVSVGFIHGDPDRPIVLQKVYNAETMPPYPLPANKTQSALQSSTSPGGGSTNEIRLQDGDGGMEFFVHASKDFHMVSGADLSEDIAVDALEEVGVSHTTTVVGAESVSVGARQSLSVTGNCSNSTNGAKTVNIAANDDLGVTGNASVACDGSRTETIGGMMNVLANSVSETFNDSCTKTVAAAQAIASATVIIDAAGGAKSELVGAAKLELIGKAKAEQITGPKTLIAGYMTEKTGADIGYTATGALGFQVGGSIAETCGGDFGCTAKAILITAPGGINIKGGGTPYTLKGANITVDAGSMGIAGDATIKLDGTVKYKP